MARIWRHPAALPVLWGLSRDDVLVPQAGSGVPFTITTTPFVDANGYEALFLYREFAFDRPRRFVDTLRWDPERGCVVDLLGWRGHLAVDLTLAASDGNLAIHLGTQWLRVRDRYASLPRFLGASGTLLDSYDDDAEEFRVDASVDNTLLGRVFGYTGEFQHAFSDGIDEAVASRHHRASSLPGGTR